MAGAARQGQGEAAVARGAVTETDGSAPPWWRLPIVWMVIGGPALVVVASFATLTIALRHPDPVLAAEAAVEASQQPAVQARNHAATPR